MNKTVNSILFVAGATVFLCLTILIVFFGLLLPLSALFSAIGVPPDNPVKSVSIGLIFIVSLLGGVFIYNAVLKLAVKKYDIEKYLLPRKEKPKKPAV